MKQIIEFKLKRPGPPGRNCTPIQLIIFKTKQKSLKKIFQRIIIYS